MVVRYGAINETEGEIDNNEDEDEDNVSESSIISVCHYKTIIFGETK